MTSETGKLLVNDMTIEHSLRRRAFQAKGFGVLWICTATLIFVIAFLWSPFLLKETILVFAEHGSLQLPIPASDSAVLPPDYIAGIGLFAVAALLVCYGTYLLGRSAMLELERSAFFNGLADAVCIAGNDFVQLEKAIALFVPSSRHLRQTDILSMKEVKALLQVLNTKP